MRTARRLPPLAATCLVVALSLGACASADDDTDAASSPAEGSDPAAGSCLEGDEDCVDADLSGDGAPPPDGGEAIDEAAILADSEQLLGETEEDALAEEDVRIGRRGDEEFALTFDLQPGRRTIATEDDGTGTFRVVEVTVELTDGSQTLTAD
jgi:hypothetical protein